jgi:hypothetical protein
MRRWRDDVVPGLAAVPGVEALLFVKVVLGAPVVYVALTDGKVKAKKAARAAMAPARAPALDPLRRGDRPSDRPHRPAVVARRSREGTAESSSLEVMGRPGL